MFENEFKGKVVLVTGGSRGIGFAAVKGFLAAGAKVYFLSHYEETGAKALAALKEINPDYEVMTKAIDLCDYKAVQELYKEIIAKWGRLDVLVNNAGTDNSTWLTRLKQSEWDAVCNLNMKAPYTRTPALLAPPIPAKKDSGMEMTKAQGQLATRKVSAR